MTDKIDFIFEDSTGRLFRVRTLDGKPWLYRRHLASTWVTQRVVSEDEIPHLRSAQLPDDVARRFEYGVSLGVFR